MLEAKKLQKSYQMGDVTVQALKEVNFQAGNGEFVAIMGPSGSGKSTLLHLLGGLDTPTSGEIFLDGTKMDHADDDRIAIMRRQKIGFIFQFFNLMPTLSVIENIALPLLIDGRNLDDYMERINSLTEMVGLGDRKNHKPTQLSGGQQQRVAIARALVTQPALVLADEPTGNLDSKSSQEILELLRHASDAENQTVVMVTHDAHAAAFADRVVYLRDGSIIHELGADMKRTTQTIRAIMTELESS